MTTPTGMPNERCLGCGKDYAGRDIDEPCDCAPTGYTLPATPWIVTLCTGAAVEQLPRMTCRCECGAVCRCDPLTGEPLRHEVAA